MGHVYHGSYFNLQIKQKRPLFYTSFIQWILEMNHIQFFEVDLAKARNIYTDIDVKFVKYNVDIKGVYYYQDDFCKFYKDKFVTCNEPPKGYVPWKGTIAYEFSHTPMPPYSDTT